MQNNWLNISCLGQSCDKPLNSKLNLEAHKDLNHSTGTDFATFP